MRSGLPAGTGIEWEDHFEGDIIDFEDIWLEGVDMGLFEFTLVDEDNDASNGYFALLTAIRPLPSGEYEIERHFEPYNDTLCRNFMPNGFKLKRYSEWTVFVEASTDGMIHEAFFDPYESENRVGFQEESGVMRPPSFTVSNAMTTIQSLWWEGGTITLELTPYVQLTGYDIDIVDLDGSVRIILPVREAATDHSTGTLTWQILYQPWRTGDRLMLRIRPEGPAPPTPGPRPWISEVLNLTATVGTELQNGAPVPILRLEWTKGDEIESGLSSHPHLQLWEDSTGEWRETDAGIQFTRGPNTRGDLTGMVLGGIDPGSYRIGVRYTQSLSTNAGYLRDYFASEWKYVSVVVPEEPSDSQVVPTPVPTAVP